jgi:hypothetical protein
LYRPQGISLTSIETNNSKSCTLKLIIEICE